MERFNENGSLSACRAAALSTTMLTRRKSSIDGTKSERSRRRGESIGGAFTDMINLEPTAIINKSTELLHERFLRDMVRAACLLSMISLCLHTPDTIKMWPPLNYIILVNDILVTLIFIGEAAVTINQNGLFDNQNSYLRDRWYQFEFFLLINHILSCVIHIYELCSIWFPSLNFFYYPWFGALRSARSFIFLRFIRSIVRFKLPKKTIKLIMKRSSQQIQNVTIFFMFFVFSYAIMGVQLFGRLNYHCVVNGTDPHNVTIADLAIPDTMCSQKGAGGYECPGNMVCMRLELQPQAEGFYGQFSDFASSLFTVYLAASQEGWVYVLYDCLDSMPSFLAFFYFVTLIFFLAWLVKNVFIAVITETFAEIRVRFAEMWQTRETTSDHAYTQKLEKDENGWKLVEVDKYNRAHSNNSLFLHTIVTSTVFQTIMQLLILANAIFHATFVFYHDESDQIRKVFYYYVEVGFTILFNTEVAIKVYAFGWNAYISRGQHKFDFLLCVGSSLNAIWILYETNFFTYFQVFRIARLIKASPMLEDFVYKIFGPGKKLGGLVIFTAILLLVTSAISLQLFCYVPKLNRFTNFAAAFMTMFQIITQEGWTDVVIEILRACNEQAVPFVAIYFVAYHLLVTLFVLSLFVAVILDNLEMDEELKKVKQLKAREQDTIKTTLPMRLRIFNRFPTAPTMVTMKKVSSEFPLPKIRDSFTRQFADEFVETSDDPMQEIGLKVRSMLSGKGPSKETRITTTIRHVGQLSNKTILTSILTESNRNRALFSESNQHLANFTRSNTSSKHGKSGILSATSRSRTRGLASLKGKNMVEGFKENGDLRPEDTARKVEKHGEIDFKAFQMKRAHAEITRNRIEEEMRENHPMFDRPLFLVGRESSLRRMCQMIAHSRHSYDQNDGQHRKNSNKYKQFHDLLAIITYLDWAMVLVTTLSCCSMLWESPWPLTGENLIFNNFYLQIAEYIFVLVMSFELTVKCIANGLFFTPKALVTDVGDILTIFIYITSLIFVIWMPTHIEINSWAQLLMICRASRPLRVYALIPHIRRVVVELCRGFREILLVTILLVVLMFIFASFGVQLVGGKLAACNDLSITSRENCTGLYDVKLFVTRLEVYGKNEAMHPSIIVPRVWTNPRNFNFDHIGNAMLALFETLSYKGWNVVRDVLYIRHGAWAVIFIHIYVFIGCMIGLTLFVGVVVANYTENRGTALLTVDQRRWHDLKARLKMAQPLHVPPKPPESAKVRCYLYDMTTSRWFKQTFAALVVLNSLTLIIPWNVSEERDRKKSLLTCTLFSALFNILFTLECLLKMIAFTLSGFWQSRRNRIDLIITVLGINWIVFHFLFQLPAYFAGGISEWKRLTYTYGYLVVILRFFTIAGRKSTLKMLMLTVVMSMVRSSFIIAAMFLLVLFYANAGVVLFGMVKYGQAVGKHVNFRNGREALVVLFRSVTGEDWNDIMHDCMRAPPFCNWHPGLSYWQTDCGNYVGAIVYFCSFYLIITYIVLNLLVAIIMENFSLFYSSVEDQLLSYADIRNFQLIWNMVDVEQKRSIPVRRVKFLLRLLRGRLEVPDESDGLLFKHMCHEMERLHNGDDVSFHDVLNVIFLYYFSMLSYRSVDIRKNLQLEELLQREELEYIIEEEVAKHTIRQWLEHCLKNIKAKQNNTLGKMSSIGSTFAFPQQDVLTKGVFLTEASPDEESLQGDKGSGKKKASRGNSITEIVTEAQKKSVKREADKIKERRGTLRQMQMGTYDELEEVEEDEDTDAEVRRSSFEYSGSDVIQMSHEKQLEDVKTWWTLCD
ncbi:hypothetical protein B9Z55_028444 [Caenorhabditis nigoni]|uniref:Ion transport domain-containing protein n=3 Tax=Caenorhabditis nigoni TaxID=1611254 RepID=A0A2G5SBH8_9PELO|nr:hypothetical protein B9Z55_028444 [Caenorhabditis nigoni]